MPKCETTGYDVPSADAVNHPAHYTSHPSGVECISITEHMTFNAGNAVKYLWRAGLKTVLGVTPFGNDVLALLPLKTLEKHIEDLKKARWYIEREIERMQKQIPSTCAPGLAGAAEKQMNMDKALALPKVPRFW